MDNAVPTFWLLLAALAAFAAALVSFNLAILGGVG